MGKGPFELGNVIAESQENLADNVFYSGDLPPDLIRIEDFDLGYEIPQVPGVPYPSLEGYWSRDDLGYLFPKSLGDGVYIGRNSPIYDEIFGISGTMHITGKVMFSDNLVYISKDGLSQELQFTDSINGTVLLSEVRDKKYTHNQIDASSEWIITHNLKKRVCVQVFDTDDRQVIGLIEYVDDNTVKVKFNKDRIGYAYCN